MGGAEEEHCGQDLKRSGVPRTGTGRWKVKELEKGQEWGSKRWGEVKVGLDWSGEDKGECGGGGVGENGIGEWFWNGKVGVVGVVGVIELLGGVVGLF